MAKVVLYPLRCMVVLLIGLGLAPETHAQYPLLVHVSGNDTASLAKAGVQTDFRSMALCRNYVFRLPSLLQVRGFPAASVDSARFDSASASIDLYLGEQFTWAGLYVDSSDRAFLESAGWPETRFRDKPVDLSQLVKAQNAVLDYLENNGYPFAALQLDSVRMEEGKMYARLVLNKGPLYTIDSIRNMGEASISNNYLQHYLNIMNGSTYRKERLMNVSRKLAELPFLEEQQHWDMTYLGTGSVLNLYLKPKRSSQINILLGFLPATQYTNNVYDEPRTKLQFTGEATVNLKNALGNGETMALNWQQIQVKSPRLNLYFQQPYLFGSAFGMSAAFDLFKKDSSYQNLNLVLGAQYAVSSERTGTLFLQSSRSYLLTVDTFSVKQYHQLPPEADISSVNLGLSYDVHATDYRYNPRRGNEWDIMVSAGTKKIKKNTVIVQLHDNNDSSFDFNSLYDTVKLKSYQFRMRLGAAHFFPLGKASTFMTAFHGGWYQSPSIYRNELFQIGGYKLLRGFDEESIYASLYTVGTLEYRYLIGRNSYFFGFTDLGWSQNKANGSNFTNSYLGAGLGLAFETKAGIFNISYAAGKRNDQAFNLRQSKIHLGFISYF